MSYVYLVFGDEWNYSNTGGVFASYSYYKLYHEALGSMSANYHHSDQVTGNIFVGCRWTYPQYWPGIFYEDSDYIYYYSDCLGSMRCRRLSSGR